MNEVVSGTTPGRITYTQNLTKHTPKLRSIAEIGYTKVRQNYTVQLLEGEILLPGPCLGRPVGRPDRFRKLQLERTYVFQINKLQK